MKNMLNEHLWSGIIHRSETGEEREEDKIRTKEDLQKKIQEIIDKTHPNEGDTIDLNHLDVSRVEDMSNLFYDSNNDIDFTDYNFNVSDWDVSNVEDMHDMFCNCKFFNCNLSDWNVSRVTNMAGMFQGCDNFNGDVSNWDVSNVEDMHEMFFHCENFIRDLSNWDVSKVKDTTRMFKRCNRLGERPYWY